MSSTLYSKTCEGLEVEYEYSTSPETRDTPGSIDIDILSVKAMDSSINIIEWMDDALLERFRDEIQLQEANRDDFDETEWDDERWAA